VEVSVTDDGPGIPDDELERIFAPYVRREDVSHPGVGLGLALCRRLVEAHGGEIRAESGEADGETSGARFWFTLPGREA
jgi:two-component system sensor histidine kinase KdpD